MGDMPILRLIADILARQFSIDANSVTPATTAHDVDGWDSVSHVYVIMEVERKFAFRVPDERVLALQNVGDLVDLVTKLRNR